MIRLAKTLSFGCRVMSYSFLPRIESHGLSPAENYLDSLSSLRSSETMRSVLNNLAHIFGQANFLLVDWSKLRRQHCLHAMLVLKQKELSPATINVYLACLKGVAREAWNMNLMPLSTFSRIDGIKSVHYERLPVGFSLTLRQCKRLLSVCDDGTKRGARDKAIFAVMMGCGLRRAEIVSLTIDSWNEQDRSFRFVGKGNKERIVFLPDDLRPVIDAWIAVRGDDDGTFFPRMKPGKLHEECFVFTEMSPISIYRILKFRSEQARIKDLRPHDLRRTFASRMLDAGCDLSLLQKAMGHSSPATTARYDRRDEKSRIKACRSLRFQ